MIRASSPPDPKGGQRHTAAPPGPSVSSAAVAAPRADLRACLARLVERWASEESERLRGTAGHDAARESLLARALAGDPDAQSRLSTELLDELYRQAAQRMKGQPRSHALTPTALAHEAIVRIAPSGGAWDGRRRFLATAGMAMDSILVDHSRRARRRGPEADDEQIDEVRTLDDDDADRALDVRETLASIAARDPRSAAVVELKVLEGLTTREIAARLGMSPRSVERSWEHARDQLARRLG